MKNDTLVQMGTYKFINIYNNILLLNINEYQDDKLEIYYIIFYQLTFSIFLQKLNCSGN